MNWLNQLIARRRAYLLGGLLIGLLLGCTLPSVRRAATPEPLPTPVPPGTPTRAPVPTPTRPAPTSTPVVPTATPTSAPTSAPTTAPELTQQVGPHDLSGVRITSEDLPGMFIPMDLSALGVDPSTLSDGGYEIENLQLFASLFPPEFVITALVQTSGESDQAAIDLLLDNPEVLLQALASQVGEVQEHEVWEDAPQVGEKASGVSLIVGRDDQEFKVDMILFRRDGVIAIVADMYPRDAVPRVSLVDVATLLDERLQAALAL